MLLVGRMLEVCWSYVRGDRVLLKEFLRMMWVGRMLEVHWLYVT